jgi:hypothetical protein
MGANGGHPLQPRPENLFERLVTAGKQKLVGRPLSPAAFAEKTALAGRWGRFGPHSSNHYFRSCNISFGSERPSGPTEIVDQTAEGPGPAAGKGIDWIYG